MKKTYSTHLNDKSHDLIKWTINFKRNHASYSKLNQ